MEDKKKLLDEALDRILSGPIGSKKGYQWDASIRLTDMNTEDNPMKKTKGYSKGHLSKLKKGWKPYTKNFEIYNAKTSKKVSSYDKEGTLIKTYSSISQAARELNINRAGIVGAIKRKGTAGNYYWKYIED